MILPWRRQRTMPASFKKRSWWLTVVWLMPKTREMSVTHISEMASAESIRRRVLSAKMEKKRTSAVRTSPSGTYPSGAAAVPLGGRRT